jgi:nickel/cobalt transporter (NicO) family protein
MQKIKLTLILLLIFLIPQSAQAHPADMYFHSFRVNLDAEGVQVFWELVPGPMVTHVVWHDADTSGDEEISDAEAEIWIAPLLSAFSAKLDGTPLKFEFASVEWANSLPELRTGESPIIIELRAEFDSASAQHELILLNEYNSANSLNWFTVNAEGGIRFSAPEQDNGLLKLRFGASDEGADVWESGMPSIPPVVEALGLGETAEDAMAQAENQQGILAILEGFLRTPNISPLLFLAAFAISLILGALHALSPGHGKTIVAAYLVGSQGKAYHAIALGLLVTLTHTGSVFALGLATLSLSQYIMPNQLFPALELVSGVLILVLGIGLLLPRLRTWLTERRRAKALPVAKKIEKKEKSTRLVLDEEIREPGPEHNHDPSQFGYVPIPKGMTTVAENPLSGISWKSLIALGISGGLVPCPDAIAILLIAVTINKIAFGLGLIISFSLGLAVVLIVIGIVMVQSKQIFARLQWFSRVSFIVPVLSALVVLGLGTALSISAFKKFPDGFLQKESTSSFELGEAYVTYLAIDDAYHKQLYLVSATGGEVQQITNGDTGVWNYNVSPDGRSLIYSVPDGKTGSELWLWNAEMDEPEQILHCPEISCSDALWSPQSSQILYSRLEFGDEQAYLGIPSLWWLDLESGETQPLFQDSQLPGYNPRWSFHGRWLSYTSASPQEIQVYNLQSGERQTLPTEIGSAAVWSPIAEEFLLADLQSIDDMYLSKISLYDVADGTLTPLPSEENFDDNNPAWSVDGKQIAFARGEWTLDSASAGDQLWLMDARGENQHPLTEHAETTHGSVAWSADGRYLLYRAYSVKDTEAPSQIRIFDLETGEEILIAAPGDSPNWFFVE